MAAEPKIVYHAQKHLFLAVSLATIGGLLLQRNYISARIDKIRNSLILKHATTDGTDDSN